MNLSHAYRVVAEVMLLFYIVTMLLVSSYVTMTADTHTLTMKTYRKVLLVGALAVFARCPYIRMMSTAFAIFVGQNLVVNVNASVTVTTRNRSHDLQGGVKL